MLHYRELLQSLQSIGSLHSDTKEEPIFYHLNYQSIQILNFIKFLESNSFYRICSSNHIHNRVPHIHTCTLKVIFFNQYNQSVLPLLITLLTFCPFNAQNKQGIFTEHIKSKEPAGQAICKLFTSPLSSEQQKRHILLSAVRQQNQTQVPTPWPNFPSSPTTVCPPGHSEYAVHLLREEINVDYIKQQKNNEKSELQHMEILMSVQNSKERPKKQDLIYIMSP